LSTGEIAAWVYAEINNDGYGFADELLEQMKEVLGPEGFKTIKQTAWSDFLHCPEPAGEETKYDFKKSRYKIILLEIARITHDDRLYLKTCEAVIDSGPHAYLELVRKLDDLHLLDKAIARLYEGIERHPDDQNFSLREMLCRMLEKKGDIEKAFEIAHALLPEHPSLYPRIKILAQKLNTWDRTKQEIIEQFTEHDHLSELIGLYLAENQLAEAIAIAEKYEDPTPIVWETARLAEGEYPNAAVSLYQRFVDYHIDLKTRTEYKEAAKIAAKIKELLIKNGQTSTWHEYIENLRTNNKRKKNLLKVLANL